MHECRNCSFNPLMFIMVCRRIFCLILKRYLSGIPLGILIERSLKSNPEQSSIKFQQFYKCLKYAEFVQNLWKWSVNAIWHNFQRIIPQIKKSIIFLLYEISEIYKFAYYFCDFVFALSHFLPLSQHKAPRHRP